MRSTVMHTHSVVVGEGPVQYFTKRKEVLSVLWSLVSTLAGISDTHAAAAFGASPSLMPRLDCRRALALCHHATFRNAARDFGLFQSSSKVAFK